MRLRLFFAASLLMLSGCASSGNGDTPQYDDTDVTNPLDVVAACKASDLEASVQTANRSGSDLMMTVMLSSKKDGACTVAGFPTVALYDSDEKAISTTSSETDESSSSQSLAKGESVYFDLSYSEVATSADCKSASFVYVTPPKDDQSLHLPLTGDQVLSICGTAVVKVTPIRATA